jgi:hypothetical protein
MFKDGKRNRGLIEREATCTMAAGASALRANTCARLHDGSGRLSATREHLRHGLAHQRRRIVEQHQQRAFGGGAIVVGQI